MNNKIKEFWDDLFAKQIDYTDISPEVLEKLMAENLEMKSFLDLGCGTGSLMRYFEAKGVTTAGADWSVEAIKIATEKGTKGSLYVQDLEEIENLKLDTKYDVIFLKLVLAFVTNKEALLSWCKDNLNTGGMVVVNTPVSTKEVPSLKPGIAMDEDVVQSLLKAIFTEVTLTHSETVKIGIIQTYFCK